MCYVANLELYFTKLKMCICKGKSTYVSFFVSGLYFHFIVNGWLNIHSASPSILGSFISSGFVLTILLPRLHLQLVSQGYMMVCVFVFVFYTKWSILFYFDSGCNRSSLVIATTTKSFCLKYSAPYFSWSFCQSIICLFVVKIFPFNLGLTKTYSNTII